MSNGKTPRMLESYCVNVKQTGKADAGPPPVSNRSPGPSDVGALGVWRLLPGKGSNEACASLTQSGFSGFVAHREAVAQFQHATML
jgi:hypothetical protein